MGCILPILILFAPRLVMVFIALLTNWFSTAFETAIWPILGWFFMPYTTIVYMMAMLHNNHQISGGWMVGLIIAVIADLATPSSSARRAS